MDELAPKGKALKSFYLLENLGEQINSITEVLQIIPENIKNIIKDNKGNIFCTDPGLKRSVPKPKRRSIIEKMPERIEFKLSNGFKFYIDFTVEISKQDQKYDVKGSVIYGTNRSFCFTECLYPEEDKTCYICDRIGRCDQLEDKPLLKFSVDRDGIIQSSDKFEGDLWKIYVEDKKVEDKNKESLLDLHYRAIEHILEEAFYWTNENLLP